MYNYKFMLLKKFSKKDIRLVMIFAGYIDIRYGTGRILADGGVRQFAYATIMQETNQVIDVPSRGEYKSLGVDILFLYLQVYYPKRFLLLGSSNHYADWYAASVELDYILSKYDMDEILTIDKTLIEYVVRTNPYLSNCKNVSKHLPATKETSQKIVDEEGHYSAHV